MDLIYIKESIEFKIEDVCRRYGISGYTINSDGSIDVDENVNLCNKSLEKIPLIFNKVTGRFNCAYNNLRSLKGSPRECETFNCEFNQLTNLEGGPNKTMYYACQNNNLVSLEGSPRYILSHFSCTNNNLKNLIGGPEKVNGYFDCSKNELTSLEGSPKEINWGFYCSKNKLTSLKGCPKIIYGDFLCTGNQLTSLKDGPTLIINGTINCRENKITTLKWFPKIDNDPDIEKMPVFDIDFLPKQIKDNYVYIKEILNNQDDYQIWDSNGILNIERFNIMMSEIK